MKLLFFSSSITICCYFLLFLSSAINLICFANSQPVQTNYAPEATPFNKEVCSYEDYQRAVELFNIGNNYHMDNDVKNAEIYYNKSLNFFPLFGEAYLNLGNIYRGERSLWAYKKAAEVIGPNSLCPNRPLYANAMSNIGHHLVEGQGKTKGLDYENIQQAIEYYKEALRWVPEHHATWYNLGIAFEKQGFRQEAFNAYNEVLKFVPEHTGANLNIGNLLMYGGYHNASLKFHERVLQSPTVNTWYKVATLNNMAETYRFLNDVESSLKTNKRALELEPGNTHTIFSIYKTKRTLIDWEGIEDEIDFMIHLTRTQLKNGPNCTMLPYDYTLMPVHKRDLLDVAAANTYIYDGLVHPPRDPSKDHLVGIKFQQQQQPKRHKLIVGYTGYDFNNHPMGHLTCGVLEMHDRSIFGVSCYPYGSDDLSEQRKRIVKACDHFENVTMIADFKIASLMSGQGVHIAIDLMAHTRGTRLGVAAYHPGAILVNYLGYPGTIGTKRYAEYIIVDRHIVVPETATDEVSEKPVYLPHHYQANDFPLFTDYCDGVSTRLVTPEFERINDEAVNMYCPGGSKYSEKRAVEGLPTSDDAVVMCNFNTIDKLEQQIYSIWMSILSRVPNSVLWLLAPQGKTGDTVRRNFYREAQQLGIDKERLIIARRVPKFDHLDRYRYCDVFLDTFLYNAHSTASDALWAFVPLVTFEGEAFQSRVAADLLYSIGLDELVAHSRRSFEDIAVKVGKSKSLRRSIRNKLAANALTYPLFDTRRITINLERSYEIMWEVKETFKLKAQNIVVAPNDPMIANTKLINTRFEKEVEKAMTLQASGNLTSAGNIYRRLLHVDPFNTNVWHLLGILRHSQGFSETGKSFITHAIYLQEQNGQQFVSLFHHNLVEVCRSVGDIECALRSLVLTWDNQDVNLDNTKTVLHDLVQLGEHDAVISFYKAYGHHLLLPERVATDSHNTVSEILTLFSIGYAAKHQADGISGNGGGVPQICFELLSYALRMDPNYPRPWQKLAIMYDSKEEFRTAFRIYTNMMMLQNRIYMQQVNMDPALIYMKQMKHQVQLARQSANQNGKKIVVIYCNEYEQTWWPNWGPNSMDTGGVGGSEEAVIFLSKELHQIYGYHVEVYGEALPKDWGEHEKTGVWWLPHQIYDATNPEIKPDIFVAWRYHISTVLGDIAKQRYLWLQDVSPRYKIGYTNEYVDTLSGIFPLSHFHGRLGLSDYAVKTKSHVTPNALDPKYFYNGPNHNHNFIYASAPNRGLEIVLRAWPYIKAALPNAKLEVYYGFSKSFMKFGKNTIPQFDLWYAEMLKLLKHDGITYVGMADHHKLAQGYVNAGFYLYPTHYPETGCVALMKAQALGAIPITSRHYDSTLPELVGEFDLGPPMTERRKKMRIHEDPTWIDDWVNSVINTGKMDPNKIKLHREKMMKHARHTFLWSTVAGLWHQNFVKGGVNGGAKKSFAETFPAITSITMS